MKSHYDPEGVNLPVKIDATSNGEFAPIPLSRANRHGNALANESATGKAKQTGVDRRRFLVSACGVASTLLAHNVANAEAGQTGGYFAVEPEAAFDPVLAAAQLAGGEFIFDVQGHFVDPAGAWVKNIPDTARPFSWSEKTACPLTRQPGKRAYLECLGPTEFIKDVFLDSDTDMMVLSFVPSTRDSEPLTIETAAATRRIVERMEGTYRLLLHGRVNPNQPGDVEAMPELAERWGIAAWKTYTQWGPDRQGFYLHEEPGVRMIEEARRLGIKVVCIHKGLPFGRKSYEHSQCRDIGIIARQFPDVSFIVYHSGFVPGNPEKEFSEGAGRDGIDTLLQSLIDNDIPPNSNVYAELGSTWRFLMKEPNSAAHSLGKLLRYVGEDNVLWGTDSIWYGSPQDQIQAFRVFQINAALREQYGYPEITPLLRAKVFGLNATVPYRISAAEIQRRTNNDWVSRNRTAYRDSPDPHFRTYGPKTRREFLRLRRLAGQCPT